MTPPGPGQGPSTLTDGQETCDKVISKWQKQVRKNKEGVRGVKFGEDGEPSLFMEAPPEGQSGPERHEAHAGEGRLRAVAAARRVRPRH